MLIKRIIALLIVMFVMFSVIKMPVFADFVAHPRGPYVTTVNGRYVDWNISPTSEWNSVVMVPLREIVEMLGGNVDYYHTASHVWITITTSSIVYLAIIILLILIILFLMFVIFRKRKLSQKR